MDRGAAQWRLPFTFSKGIARAAPVYIRISKNAGGLSRLRTISLPTVHV